jgi:hypothetical protein
MSIRWLTIFFDLPSSGFDPATEFWLRVTGGECSPWRGPAGEFATVLPPTGDAYVRFQRVLDGAGGCHLDLHVDLAQESLAEVADRAVTLGAQVRHVEAGLTVLDSPGGFGFCLVSWDGEATVPSPIRSETGSAYRLDQLCLDIPPDRFAAEGRFWSSLTGWELRTGSRPEFQSLERPAGIPVRLLLQRRAQAEPHEPVSAHVDVACDDVRAVCESQVAAGAQVAAEFAHWTAMTDPIGRPYCLTGRDPVTGVPTGRPVQG